MAYYSSHISGFGVNEFAPSLSINYQICNLRLEKVTLQQWNNAVSHQHHANTEISFAKNEEEASLIDGLLNDYKLLPPEKEQVENQHLDPSATNVRSWGM